MHRNHLTNRAKQRQHENVHRRVRVEPEHMLVNHWITAARGV